MNLFQQAWKALDGARSPHSPLTFSSAQKLAVAELRRHVKRRDGRGIILVDGRSGSGKTQFAERLHDRVPDAQVLHLDDLYPHWEGLDAGVQAASKLVLAWSQGADTEYTPTHWPGTEARPLVRLRNDAPLIVEGVGARRCLPDPGQALAPLTIYLDVPDEFRRERALARDGEAYEPFWDTWAVQEEALLRAHPINRGDPDLIIVSEETRA